MKKVLALLLVAMLALTLAGAALASDSDGGHVTPTPTPEPVPDAGGGSGTPVEAPVVIVDVKPAVTVVVLNVAVANIVTAAQVTQPVAQAIFAVITNTVADILQAIGITGTTAAVKSESNLQVDEAEAYESNTEAIQQAAARLQNNAATRNQTAVGSLPRGMSVKESGVQPVKLPKFAKELYGKRPQLNMFPRGNSSRSVNAAAPATGGDAVFLDSTGAVVDAIPGEANTNGADAGVLTAVVYMAAGEKYDPVISIPTTEVTSDAALSAQTTTESVQEQVITTETIVQTSTFSNYVPADVITALNSATGKTYTRIANDEVVKSGWEYDAADTAYMNSFTTFKLVSITAAPQLSVQPGSYVFGVRFDSKDIKSASVDLYDETEFDFYTENEMSKGAALGVKVFTVNSNNQVVDITPAQVKAGTYTEGYIAFTIDNDGIVTAATQTLFPSLMAEVSISGSTPYIPVSGGGGGGCSAGFGAITLALLGGLFALRRKQ